MNQLDIFDQIFLEDWAKVRDKKNLARYCREVGFNFTRAWRLVLNNFGSIYPKENNH